MGWRTVVSGFALFLPWVLRRVVLTHLLGYSIDKTARIGYSLILPQQLKMGLGARIGHLNVCKPGVELLQCGVRASIGNLNWISGSPVRSSGHFAHQVDRRPELIVGDDAAVSNRHLIDCTNTVTIGRFSTLAGYRSQLLTHSIDLYSCRQSSAPIRIGDYCFVGTACVLLGGSVLPDYCVLGAQSLLNKEHTEEYRLYAGVPAKQVKQLPKEVRYFTRSLGFVE